MPDVQKVSVALTGEQVAALQAAVATGEYATTSEAVREALREWQRTRALRSEELNRLRKLWSEGKASGTAAPIDLAAIRKEARRRLKKRRPIRVKPVLLWTPAAREDLLDMYVTTLWQGLKPNSFAII